MSFWYHRCPQKATAKQTFRLALEINNADALRVLSELRLAREKLMDLLPDPRHETARVKACFESYVSLLRGFLEVENSEGVAAVSKLRSGFIIFQWSQSMMPIDGGRGVLRSDDALFEYANMMVCVALWFMKHASMRSTHAKEPSVDEAKDIMTSLKEAAGLFKAVQDQILPFITVKLQNGSDLDIRVVTAYMNQCSAEAQEVTIKRAIDLKHNSNLIASLCYATKQMFTTAADSLHSLATSASVGQRFSRWAAYLKTKVHFYEAYAYAHMAEKLLADDKCGEAVRSAQEAKQCHQKMMVAAKEYVSAKSAGPTSRCRPEQFATFNLLYPYIHRTLEKCERENGMIYHHRVALDPPTLEASPQTFGLAAAREFAMPPLSTSWTNLAYASINVLATVKDSNAIHDPKTDEASVKPLTEYDPKPG